MAHENVNYREKKIKNRAGKGYKALTVAVFTVLLIYLLGYLIVFLNKPSVSVETVSYGTIDVPVTLRGIIVREETVVNSSIDGQPYYNYSENSKVPKNAVVCTVKNADTTQIIENEIKKIDKNIIQIQKDRRDFSLFKDDIKRINGNLESIIDNNIYKFIDSNVSDMYSIKSQIDNQINLRNQIWLAENTKSTSELTEVKSNYETQLSGKRNDVRVEKSGIISLKVDKFEDILTPAGINDIAEEQIKMRVQPEYISKSMSVTSGSPLFKLITSNTWYIVSYIPNEMASKWEKGDYVKIYTAVDDEEKSVDAKVENMISGDKTTYTVFVTDKNVIDFLDLRTMDFKVEDNVYEGFKIPNEAIVEKTFIKIPKSILSSSLDEVGVIKRGADGDKFVNIKISRSDEENVYILQEFKELKLGDIIIPPGENSKPYTLSDVVSYKGVYVANSSIAEFTVIDVLGQNSEYTIVNSQSQYGLKIYDKIVSYAKSIENDSTVN